MTKVKTGNITTSHKNDLTEKFLTLWPQKIKKKLYIKKYVHKEKYVYNEKLEHKLHVFYHNIIGSK